MNVKGKNIIITGGSLGIGKETARDLVKKGANVLITGRSENRLIEAKIYTGSKIIEFDISDHKNMCKNTEKCIDILDGRVDVLINNAGVFDGGPLDTLDIETWDKVLNINLRGAFLCLREAMKIMKPQKNGKIINIGSISGQVPRLYSTPYTTSKFALTGLTKAAALEAREHNISVSIIHPGNVITELRQIRDEDKDSEPMMNPESIAELIYLSISLPNNVNLLESIMLPIDQLYIGRG